VRRGRLGGCLHFFKGGLVLPKAMLSRMVPVNRVVFLQHDANLRPQRVKRDVAQVVAVDRMRPSVGRRSAAAG